jgi:phosphonate transport system substrate-binding protein
MCEGTAVGRAQVARIVGWIVLAGLVAASCGDSSSADTPTTSVHGDSRLAVLTIGTVANDARDEVEVFTPFVDYIASKMSDVGYASGRVLVVRTIEEMSELIAAGEVDVYLDSVFPAAVVAEATGAEVRLRRWKGGLREYHSVIFARADTEIFAIEDLAGRVIAFEEEFSTSGYRLPLSMLTSAGLDTGLPAEDRNSVGFVFSEDDENTIEWVVGSRVDAGAMGVGDFERLTEGETVELRVIARSMEVPRQVVMFRRDLDDAAAERFVEIALGMTETSGANDVLLAFERTTRFEPVRRGELDELFASLLSDTGS